MDRIKKALERARQERMSAPARRQAMRAGQDRAPTSLEDIHYTQTRVVETSQGVLRDKRVIDGIGHGPVTDSYRILRTQVLKRMRDNKWNSLAITSPGIGEGKTLTAINLAISLSMEVNQTVLLADLDLRNPSIHKYFGYEPEKGISDYVTSETPLDEILINPSIDRLVILPGNTAHYLSSEMLSSPRMVELVSDLKTRYPSRLVLFDLPPLLITDDALAFTPYIDAILLVVEEGKTLDADLVRANEILGNTPVIGTVLNKAEMENQVYY